MSNLAPKRILLIDDNVEIHKDFRKLFSTPSFDKSFDDIKNAVLHKSSDKKTPAITYLIDSAFQGQEALEMVKNAIAENQPYAMAFVDIRMPPGWDGAQTIQEIWNVDPEMQMVICTAYADYSWEELAQKLDKTDNFLILKKPFDMLEVHQLTAALTKKWELKKLVQYQINNLESLVKERSSDLENSLSINKATIEASRDGILVINTQRAIILYNQVFLQQWEIDETFLKSATIDTLLIQLANKVEKSDLFINLINDLCAHPKKGIIDHFLLKNGKTLELFCNNQYLHKNIVGSVFSFQDITERKSFEKTLLYLSMHDELTGLANRSLNNDRLHQAIASAKRHTMLIAVAIINIDNFRNINDTFGDEAGNDLLKAVATRLKSHVNETDSLSRYSNDEFVVMLTSPNSEEYLMTHINNIFKLFSMPWEFHNQKQIITASIGVSIYPKDGDEAEVLIKNARIALNHAKELGRNLLQFYTVDFDQIQYKEINLISDLHQALEKNEFQIEYQPIIDLRTHKVASVEALLRWNHPKLGVMPPDIIIPIAEKHGLISAIDEWVLKNACIQNKEWHQSVYPGLIMSVNVSGQHIRNKNFVDQVINTLNETGLDPKYLNIEITEGIVLGNVPDISEKMIALKKLGINFSMDDFGTGYAGFNYLKLLPFDTIKIDKSFIYEIHTNPADQSIVDAIISMSNAVDMKIIAEGVETIEQLNYLKNKDIYFIQGYYFSPPFEPSKGQQRLNEIFLAK